MLWTKGTVLKFLDAYKAEPCIWDPSHPDHKNRSAVAVAWHNIHKSLKFNCPIAVLKKKKDSLMASFRMHFNKKKKHMNSGLSIEGPFETHWFAYNAMEKFLGPVYLYRTTVKTETMTDEESEIFDEENEHFSFEETSNNDTNFTENSIGEISGASNPTEVIYTNHRREFLEESCNMVNMSNAKQKYDHEENDECDLYGKLLAKKLRRFSEHVREEIMFQIDGLIIQKRKTFMEKNPNVS